MLRRANEHEAAAFELVERTVRRTRPRVGPLGLKAVETPEGWVERSALGRLRFHFDGHAADFEPENDGHTRPPSEQEADLWEEIQRLVSATQPVADREWNLVSMRLGPRLLRRLPLGSVVALHPDGTPPFQGSLDLAWHGVRAEPELHQPSEAELLAAIDAFLHEPIPAWQQRLQAQEEWKPPPRSADREAGHILSTTLGHGRRRGHNKWHRCPICHTPVVKGLFNPRIPYGTRGLGAGAIRDLRGGYLSRLRETYIIEGPNSLVPSSPLLGERPEPRRDLPSELGIRVED